MAHMAVMLGYPRLLGSLIGWGIDINITDLSGSTALHYAFLCNESACAILLIQSGADELALDELGRLAMSLNPTLVEERTTRLLGVSKVDGDPSVSHCPAEEELKTERPEEAASLEATYLLVHRWIERMEEERSDTNDLDGENMPHFGSPPCLPSNLGDRNGKNLSTLSNHPLIEPLLLFACSDLTVEKPHIDATRSNQSTGMVPKIHPFSDDQQTWEQALHYIERVLGVTPLPPRLFQDTNEWDRLKRACHADHDEIESLLHRWFIRLPPPDNHRFECRVPFNDDRTNYCGATMHKKWRILSHIRTHLQYRPFACGGQCGSPGW